MPTEPESTTAAPLLDSTNSARTPTRTKSWLSYPTPPNDKTLKRTAAVNSQPPQKRIKLTLNEDSESEESEDDIEQHAKVVAAIQTRRKNPFLTRYDRLTRPPSMFPYPEVSTRSILQSFVSSQKADLYKCQSSDVNAYLTPPYACSYTQAAKKGGIPLLAVATEQGSVHIMNTSRRNDWDPEPSRNVLQPHNNGIFDVQWNPTDDLLATCSGDQSTHITCLNTETTLYTLRGHTSTVKCVTWDPTNKDLLCSGGRDGTICLWDLRVGEERDNEEACTLSPVLTIEKAHQPVGEKPRRGKNAPAPKSITNLLYPDADPYGIISSSSYDGILRYWDLRLASTPRKSRSTKPKKHVPLYMSSIDPTALHGSKRSRGIISLTSGTGPTAGLVFALGADSRIHSYTLPSLEAQTIGYAHENMQTNSFYIGLSLSPCGRWLASGGTGTKGSSFLFDVSNASRPMFALEQGVELKGQLGEVGAVDWSDSSLATCADDGTVRVWRPDLEVHRRCEEDPENSKWDWSWAT